MEDSMTFDQGNEIIGKFEGYYKYSGLIKMYYVDDADYKTEFRDVWIPDKNYESDMYLMHPNLILDLRYNRDWGELMRVVTTLQREEMEDIGEINLTNFFTQPVEIEDVFWNVVKYLDEYRRHEEASDNLI